MSQQGLSFGYGTIRRFFERHTITCEKLAHATEQDRAVVTRREASRKSRGKLDGIGSSSLTRPGDRPTWVEYMAAARRQTPFETYP
ncbi:hypothetical protein ACVWXO_000811 [Bradyrhizobium sp. LM2.7]